MANDYFRFRHFTVHQGLCAMKVGTDGTLLGAWASLPPVVASPPQILDIGTGTGLIALMMAQRHPEANVVGIDIDADAVRQARANVAASPFYLRINIVEGDIVQPSTLDGALTAEVASRGFDAIISNPPFFHAALTCPDGKRTVARHDVTLTFAQLMGRAFQLLADGGELSVVVPFDAKGHIESEAALAGFFKVRQCSVLTSLRKPPRRFLLAFRKHPAPLQLSEMAIGSDLYNSLMRDFMAKEL